MRAPRCMSVTELPKRPNAWLNSGGAGTMGYSVPAAMGAKVAQPDRLVWAIDGDGCFQMTCGELATAKRQGITLPVVVLDDRWLGLIRVKQLRRQYGIYGTELQPEDYRDPPEHYFGVPAIGVRDSDSLKSAVENALKAVGPTVIEAVVNSEHYIETVFD